LHFAGGVTGNYFSSQDTKNIATFIPEEVTAVVESLEGGVRIGIECRAIVTAEKNTNISYVNNLAISYNRNFCL
jgi:hypothetical protein